jgi:hypothetical protein
VAPAPPALARGLFILEDPNRKIEIALAAESG